MVKLRIIHVLSFAGLVGSSLVMIGLLIYAARLNPVAAIVILLFWYLGQVGLNYVHCKKCERRKKNGPIKNNRH